MRLHSLKLKNIRSYTDETIEFPDGSVLLAGDIGAGKSSILLSIEFALFGLRRGEITGASLLRHGELEGKVSLTFSVKDSGESKEVTVVRGLKRTSNGVSQDAGSITIDGTTTDMTAVELKAKILEILNYPEQLLSKSKSFVFRYTVYTPQEQMKHILFEKAEDRLDTFRRLFAIDKYKQVRENTTILAREVKSKAERLHGQADDLEELQQEEKNLKDNAKDLEKNLKLLEEKEILTKKELTIAKESFEKRDKERAAYETLLKEAEVVRAKHESAAREYDRLGREVSALTTELKNVSDFDSESLQKKKVSFRKQLDENESFQEETQKKIDDNNKNEAKIEQMITHAEKAHKDIVDLDKCPTCRREVPDEYKDEIKKQTHGKISKIKERVDLISSAKEKLVLKLENLKKEQTIIRKDVEELAKQVARSDMILKRKKELDEKKKLFSVREKERATFEEELKKISARLEKEKIDGNALTAAREAAQRKDEAYQQARIAYAKLKEQNLGLEKQKTLLLEKITKKKEALV
ncbi:SMC family ATPase, partial [Candidatus Woesearchaeota archaeon]|nr:SMC family ATPase [Candidatus Woesearchaeota archaeon]